MSQHSTADADADDDAPTKSEWLAEVCYRSCGNGSGSDNEEEPRGDGCTTHSASLTDHCGVDWKEGSVRWRHPAEWEARYEPKPSKDEKGDATLTVTSAKLSDLPAVDTSIREGRVGEEVDRPALLDSLREEMEVKVMDILLEVLARVLVQAETSARRHGHRTPCDCASASVCPSPNDQAAPSSSATAEAAAASALPRLLNSLAAVTLTYRYERHGPPKFVYLRRTASDQAADAVRIYLDAFDAFDESDRGTAVASAAERAVALKGRARAFVDANSAMAEEVVVGLLDERVTGAADEALDGALAVTQDKLEEAQARLDGADLHLGGGGGGGAPIGEAEAPCALVDDDGGAEPEEGGGIEREREHTGAGEPGGQTRMEKLRHAVAGGTEKLRHAVAERGAEAKAELASKDKLAEDVIRTMGGLVKRVMIRSVGGLIAAALRGLDGLIETLAEAHEKRTARAAAIDVDGGGVGDDRANEEQEREREREQEREQELREQMIQFVERVHSNLESVASADTGTVVKILGHTMNDRQLVALVHRLT